MGRHISEHGDRAEPKRRRPEDSTGSGKASSSSPSSSLPREMDALSVDNSHLVSLVKSEYFPVSQKYWKRVETEGYDFFRPGSRQYAHTFIPKPGSLVFYENRSMTAYAPVSKYKTSSPRGQICVPISVLTDMPTAPPMRYWTHTNVNIVGQSELALSHLPYLGEENNSAVFEDLAEAYDDGIHGQTNGWGQIINDFILFHLVDRLLKKKNWQNHGKDLEILMDAVFKVFPNKNSARDMVNNFPDLIDRFDPVNAVKRTVIYTEFGEFNKGYNLGSALSSTAHLLCKRCGSVDCVFHPSSVTMHDVHIEREADSIGPDSAPCGLFCYRHFQHFDLKSPKMPGRKRGNHNVLSPNDLKKDAPQNVSPEWTEHEKTSLRMLMAAKLTSFCRVTQILSTMVRTSPKTCKEVVDYIRKNGPFEQDFPDPSQLYKNKRLIEPATNSHHRMFRSINGGRLTNEKPYRSCNHDGECLRENGCTCRINDIMCTKYCGCPVDCQVRFPGCRCKPGNCRTKMCQCYYASWECDPDLCVECNCGDYDEIPRYPVCRNINFQRSYQRRLYIAESEVAGIGCFAGEFIPKTEFIGEYVGELITQDEAERRGKVYDKFKCSYLFTLNHEQAVDATRVGNIVRFVNHSKNPNCRAKVMVVSGDHHIGLFALTDILPHDELFFDYSYNKSQLSEFVYKERKNVRPSPESDDPESPEPQDISD